MNDYYDLSLLTEKVSQVHVDKNDEDTSVNEDLSVVYGIIVALEHLEKVFAKDGVSYVDYEEACRLLLQQWRSCLRDEHVASVYESFDSFCSRYKLHCPRAKTKLEELTNTTSRLTVETSVEDERRNASQSPQTNSTAKAVAQVVQNFITIMDAIRLNLVAKKQMHPLLAELMCSLDDLFEDTNETLKGRAALVQWLIKLNKLEDDAQLDADDRQLFLRDLEAMYTETYNKF
ncbi:ESCRT I complex subunit Vps28 [Schizosaccharomyces japonicus yFS275]|uniref:Vacuolar protein sorting-associated protein 28 n=1 Tax=Schizosaccharomyces japonicus (strain yFS275 / FY16936) TaxID=402676 RepID=B6K6L4_SCHJY|nr:ESCRT I complex subunit Vps28 [Schizosaccharomyces japonicus yFS275]EEB09168.1 ESCRT I complex subunit Vps28 [Schizosaccharomyces japonicus yFS275]